MLPEDYDGSQSLNLSASSADCFESYTKHSLANFESDITERSFEKLTAQQCLSTFAVDYLYGHKSLAILSRNLTWAKQSPIKFVAHANTPSAYNDNMWQDPFSWMCQWHDTTQSQCSSSAVQSQMPDWKIYASDWQEPRWEVTVPWRNGSVTYTQDNYTVCYGDRFCSNMNRLASLVWLDPARDPQKQDLVPLTSQDLKNYTSSPSFWGGSSWSQDGNGNQTSWAEHVTWQQTGTQCTRYNQDLNSAYQDSVATIDKDFDFYSIGLYTVDGCLSMKSEQHCQLLFNPLFSIIVILSSVAKVACIVFVSQRERESRVLTVGDAIASFLSRPDPFTVGRCTFSSSDWIKPYRSSSDTLSHTYQGVPQQRLDYRKRRWWEVVTPKQWGLTIGV